MSGPVVVEFDFDAWHAANFARREALTARLVEAFERERTVWESWDSASGHHSVMWACGLGKFLEPYDSDPAYLAEHLVSRHFGFGWDLEVQGVRFRMGYVEPAHNGGVVVGPWRLEPCEVAS